METNHKEVGSLPVTEASILRKPYAVWLLIFLVIILLGTTGVFAFKYYELKEQVQQKAAVQQEISTDPITILAPSSSPNNYETDWGYQNNEMNFSLEYPKTWTTFEDDYIGKAKHLRISSKDLGVAIFINYLKKGSEGQTGPTGMFGEEVNKGTFMFAGKALDRNYYIYQDDTGKNVIDIVYYSDPTKDRDQEFFIDNLQLTVSVQPYMDENSHLGVGEGLTPDKIQKAEEILSTFKLIN